MPLWIKVAAWALAAALWAIIVWMKKRYDV